MKKIYTLFLCLMTCLVMAYEGQPYQIYNSKGKKVSYAKMIKKIKGYDVVLFGEFHDNSLGHWLQLQVTKSLGQDKKLILGAEMFEADNQVGLTQYVKGEMQEEELVTKVSLWQNYTTDYKPLVEYAKQNNLDFIATNVPRRYASMIFKSGIQSLDSISDEEKSWIAPLPFPYDANLPGYKAMLSMFDASHVNEDLPKAQAIKDATMAYFIQKNFVAEHLFLHFNGSYHSNNDEGIVWYLKNYAPELKISTITMVVGPNVDKFSKDNKGLADFIIVIDDGVFRTF